MHAKTVSDPTANPLAPPVPPPTPPKARPSDDPSPPEEGLRSPQGIRWLLLVGASVVAVSVVRLVASEWHQLAPPLQFLVLVAGALGIFAAGDVTRHRLRLPVAGSGLLGLFAVLVPLLAWGAGRQQILASPWGTLAAAVGLAALVAAIPRLLRITLDLRDPGISIALGTLLFAVPLLPQIEAALPARAHFALFLTVSLLSAGLMRATSLRLNRELFHRDRLLGQQGPVQMVPFLALMLTYLLAVFSLEASTRHLAIPLAWIALALIDTGNELVRALGQALGRPLERWPTRSRAFLAAGWGLAVATFPLAFADSSGRSAAVVSTLFAVRLAVWGLKGAKPWPYGAGLGLAIVAYHLFPTLVPDAIRQLYRQLLLALGLNSTGAAVSLADLGLLAFLIATGIALRRHLDPTLMRLHGVAVALVGMFALSVGLVDPAALRVLVIPATALLLGALIVLRTPGPLVGLYQAILLGTLVWVRPLDGAAFDTLGLVTLAVVNMLWLLALAQLDRRHVFPADDRRSWCRLGAIPGLILVAFLALPALKIVPWAGSLLLATGGVSLFAAGSLLRQPTPQPKTQGSSASAAQASDADPYRTLGALCLTVAAPTVGLLGSINHETLSMAAAALGFLLLAVVLRIVGSRRYALGQAAQSQGLSWILIGGAAVHAAFAGLLSLVANPTLGTSPWMPLIPAFLASAFFALLALDDYEPPVSALASAGLFIGATTALVSRLPALTREVYCLGPGLALVGLAWLLRDRLGRQMTSRLFTAGAVCLYAMPVWGLLGEVAWGWQALLLLLAVAFGALAFHVRSRSLLLASSAALLIDLAFFLVELRRAAPNLLWVLGIVFGLALMAAAALLEHRREALQQRVRVWGSTLRTWS